MSHDLLVQITYCFEWIARTLRTVTIFFEQLTQAVGTEDNFSNG